MDPNGLSRPGSSSSMVFTLPPCINSCQASVRPTNVFSAPEVPTTPKKKRTIYGDRYCITFMDNLLIFTDSFQIERVLIYKQVSVFSKVQIPLHQSHGESTVQEKLTLKEVTSPVYCTYVQMRRRMIFIAH